MNSMRKRKMLKKGELKSKTKLLTVKNIKSGNFSRVLVHEADSLVAALTHKYAPKRRFKKQEKRVKAQSA